MRIAFLAIGNELLQGKITDANGPWLTKFLRPLNSQLVLMLQVGDSFPEIHAALNYLYQNADLVICSGGLGPTPDDVTKEALGDFFGRGKPRPSSAARAVAQKNYDRFERLLPEGHGYGFLPDGFVPLDNPGGMAPGLWYSEGKRHLLAAPGVPKEFRDLLRSHLPQHLRTNGDQVSELLIFRTKGLPEEKIFGEICPGLWKQLEAYGSVSSLPHAFSVDVGVAVNGTKAEVEKARTEVRQLIYSSALQPHIWHEGPESLEELIILEASAKGVSVALAESCTGGLVASRLTNVPGSSAVLLGGVVAYDNAVKERVLGVDSELLQRHGAVSEPVAQAMAEGARVKLGASIAVSTTGIAGPGGGTPQKPVGTVWVGSSSNKETRGQMYQFKGDREALKFRFSQVALFSLLDLVRASRSQNP